MFLCVSLQEMPIARFSMHSVFGDPIINGPVLLLRATR
ncbi:hypothetical protein APHDU1_0874 [Anaplasma phagocytophilum]|nr:hypothetical protein APHDU1_0874 [Anaplasma phagocytophilum]